MQPALGRSVRDEGSSTGEDAECGHDGFPLNVCFDSRKLLLQWELWSMPDVVVRGLPGSSALSFDFYRWQLVSAAGDWYVWEELN